MIDFLRSKLWSRRLDALVLRISGSPKDAIKQQLTFQKTRQAATQKEDGNAANILFDLEMLDGKSSALLSHVSVIIAAIALSLGVVNFPFVKFLLVVELSLYVLVALCALRCLNFLGPPNMDGFEDVCRLEKIMLRECTIRRHVYYLCLRATVWLTIAIPFIIALEVILEIFWPAAAS